MSQRSRLKTTSLKLDRLAWQFFEKSFISPRGNNVTEPINNVTEPINKEGDKQGLAYPRVTDICPHTGAQATS